MRKRHKKFGAEVEDFLLYALVCKDDNTFILGSCAEYNFRNIYRNHIYGMFDLSREWTAKIIESGKWPCLFVLETRSCTKDDAIKNLKVWNRIFIENGFSFIKKQNTHLQEIDNLIYEKIKNEINFKNFISCQNCKSKIYRNEICKNIFS